MRILRAAPEIIMWVLIIGAALANVAIYSGVVLGEDAIDLRVASDTGEPAEDSPAARAIAAETDSSPGLPGTFVPTQGRRHTPAYGEDHEVPFCAAGEVSDQCYASNPPTSGLHLPVQRGVELPDGNVVNIPPDPGIYDFEVPRESIPHLQEHAGVYVGYHCVSAACDAAVESLTNAVSQQLDRGERVVMAPSSDLPEDTIGLASWTRYDTFPVSDYSEGRALRFIEAHSCRFDPEGFCAERAPSADGEA
jgi:hypothetical protein